MGLIVESVRGVNRRSDALVMAGNEPVVVPTGVAAPANLSLAAGYENEPAAIVDAVPVSAPDISSIPLPVNVESTAPVQFTSLDGGPIVSPDQALPPSNAPPVSLAAQNGFRVVPIQPGGVPGLAGIDSKLLLVGLASLFMVLKGGL